MSKIVSSSFFKRQKERDVGLCRCEVPSNRGMSKTGCQLDKGRISFNMAVAVSTGSISGMRPVIAVIEASFVRGFAGLKLLGNTSEVLRDGKERAKAALEMLGLHLPPQTMLLNVSPADVRSDGSQFDLAFGVAMAALLVERPLQVDPRRYLFCAELGITGELRPVKGIVSFAVLAMDQGFDGIVIAAANTIEIAALGRAMHARTGSFRVVSAAQLRDVVGWLAGEHSNVTMQDLSGNAGEPSATVIPNVARFDDMYLPDVLEDVALCHAVGGHSMLLRGPPGTGKSMFARRLASIWPPLDPETHIEAMKVHSAYAQKLEPALLQGYCPQRAPHHQASANAILGTADRPGEVALAHGGILFLDEFSEFRRDLLEALREPLEAKEITVARAQNRMTWPARFVLVAASNNCQCGYLGSKRRKCRCSMAQIAAYAARFSGPIIERIDMHVDMDEDSIPTADVFDHITDQGVAGVTERLSARVARAREFIADRQRRLGCGNMSNAELSLQSLIDPENLTPEGLTWIEKSGHGQSSVRAAIRLLRLGRTLADLDGVDKVGPLQLARAVIWRESPSH